jgi:hypothetical protein
MFLRSYAVIGLLFTQSSTIAYTGNEWRDVSESQRKANVFGVLDSWNTVGRISRETKERDPNADFGALARAVRGGWKTVTMVQRYAHLAPNRLHEAVERLVSNGVTELARN